MTKPEIKSRLDFATSEAWQSYVAKNVAPQDRSYVLAHGEAMLYFQFYGTQHNAVPIVFLEELHRIERLRGPQKTAALKELNRRIFADMARLVMEPLHGSGTVIIENPRAVVEKLLRYIGEKNTAFAMWVAYKRVQNSSADVPAWEEYVRALLPADAATEAAFLLLMGQMGELLYQFRDQNLPLPGLVFRRIWFLHHEPEGAERNLHARFLVHELLEAITPCTSA